MVSRRLTALPWSSLGVSRGHEGRDKFGKKQHQKHLLLKLCVGLGVHSGRVRLQVSQ